MTVSEFADYVIVVSTQVANEPTASPILDASMAVKVLLPAVLRETIRRRIKNGAQIQNLIKFHTVPLSRGAGDLPEGVSEEFADFMQVGTSGSDLGLFSYIPQYFDFIREPAYILPRFTLRDNKIYATKSGASLTSIVLYALTIPVFETEEDEIEADEAFMDDCLTLTASILRGEMPMAAIGISNEITGAKK